MKPFEEAFLITMADTCLNWLNQESRRVDHPDYERQMVRDGVAVSFLKALCAAVLSNSNNGYESLVKEAIEKLDKMSR